MATEDNLVTRKDVKAVWFDCPDTDCTHRWYLEADKKWDDFPTCPECHGGPELVRESAAVYRRFDVMLRDLEKLTLVLRPKPEE